MIARRDTFNLCETGVVQVPCQHNVANYPISPQTNGCKTHSHLKRNAGLLRHHTHRPAALDQLRELSEECYRMPTLSS